MPQKMRVNTSPKYASFSLKTLSAAVFSALVLANASAAGLGKLTVSSALGQPLRAEIELTSVTKEQAATLSPKLAPAEAFRQANIDFNPALYSLRFAVVQRGDRQFISISSSQAMNEPFVDLLLELGGTENGRLVREYTFLLDPADLRGTQPPEVVSGRPAASHNIRNPVQTPSSQDSSVEQERGQSGKITRVPKETRIKPPKPAPAPAVADNADVPKHEPAKGDYQVKSGDSLSKIAGQLKPAGVSLDQMIVALYRANQNAFVHNNMNRLRSGESLAVPDAATATSISSGEAKSVIIAQSSDFGEYRNKLAGHVMDSEVQKSTGARHGGSGKIVAHVEEAPTPANTSKDKLTLSHAGGTKGANTGSTEEEKIANKEAIREANERVKLLEKNVKDLQDLLDKNKKATAVAKNDTPAATATTTATAAVPVKPAQPAIPALPAIPASLPVPTPVTPPPVMKAPASASVVASVASTPASASAAASVTPPVTPSESVATPPKGPHLPEPKPIVQPELPWYADLLGNPFVWGGAALLLVGAGAAGIYGSHRKRKDKAFGDSIITDSSLKANSLFGSTGGQSVDTNNSVFNSNFSPSVGELNSNEVDPVAEADVYIAYGRDAQAEEILKEALRTQPERHAVRVKLLEIYANRKDLRSFEVLASELYGLTKGEGEDWHQAAALGLSIDPKNPLYASGSFPQAGTVSVIGAHTQPLDEPDLDDLVPNTHNHPSMDSPNTIEESSYFGSSTLGRNEPDTLARQPAESQPQVTEELPLDISTSLDFDLDGMDDEPIETAPVIPPATPAAPVVAEHKPDFNNIDFDFLEPQTPSTPAEPIAPIVPAEPEHVIDHLTAEEPSFHIDDLHTTHTLPDLADHHVIKTEELDEPAPKIEPAGLDFDLSGITLELGSPEKPHPVSHVAGEPDNFDASTVLHRPELHEAEIRLPESHAVESHVPDFHIPDLHVPEVHDLDIHPLPVASSDTDHGLPDLMHDLPQDIKHDSKHDAVPDLMPHLASESELDIDTHIGEEEYSNHAEMATKLDLAIAYQEIGDKEGARELLDEVIKGGASAEHSEKAKALLAKLG